MEELTNQTEAAPESRATAGRDAAAPTDAHAPALDFTNAPARVRHFVAARRYEVLSACLLLLMCANLLAVISRKTITNDEIVHIPAGYYHLVEGLFQVNNEHPPLVKMWAALPLLFVQPDESPEETDPPPENFTERTWRYQERFWPDNDERFDSITFWTRVWMLPLTLSLGALIFLFARRIFNARAAALAVALYTFEPTFLAHGRIVHTDVPAALAFMLFFFALVCYRDRPTLRRALLVGLACGAALVTKFSMSVLAPVLGLSAAAAYVFAPRLGWPRQRVALHAGLAVAVVWLCVNAAYFFQSPPLAAADVEWVRTQSAPSFDRWMAFFGFFSKLFPTYFLFGLYNVAIHNQYGHPTSLLGEYGRTGWWYYFPVAYALKTSLPVLLTTAAGLAWSVWRLVARREWRLVALLGPLALYAALSLSSKINIGIRHFLPAFPFLLVAGGALLDRLLAAGRGRALRVAVVALALGWSVAEVWRAFPNYIPYMNQLAYEHPRWWYLSDSNVEWGDDNRALAEYLRARGETLVRGSVSGGWGVLRHYGIGYAELFPRPGVKVPDTTYVAVGAGALNGSTVGLPPEELGRLEEYRRRTPEAVFGESIYLYRVK
ncbi:MAG TPA: glycosyltransferase family 39 protein [Pyrinomonadaceae bacterium]|nr:glycosyltransferase family 39 protein [Pyrinomonadaceae bacterium]